MISIPGVSKEQIKKAREIDLLSYLQTYEPHELIRSGPNEYRTASHHSLILSNGLWHWVNGNVGGKSALDYLVHVRDFGFVEAVEMLCGVRAALSIPPQSVKTPVKFQFASPRPNNNDDRVIAYLQSRGIDPEIIKACIENGDLYESEKTHNCVFIGYDKYEIPRFACLRGTFSDYKQDVEGSQKQYGYCLSTASGSKSVCVFESPIDALSAATLSKMKGEAWELRHYLSLGGTSPLALLQFLNDRPTINHVILSLDNDKAGYDGAQRIIEAIKGDAVLNEQITDISNEPPEYGKDCNEQLQHILREQKSITDPSRRKAAISL